jgi:hypothetical protein
MSPPHFHAHITRRGALGFVEAEGKIDGAPEFVSGELVRIIDEAIAVMTPGDTMTVEVAHKLPPDHPLAGVDLDADREPT